MGEHDIDSARHSGFTEAERAEILALAASRPTVTRDRPKRSDPAPLAGALCEADERRLRGTVVSAEQERASAERNQAAARARHAAAALATLTRDLGKRYSPERASLDTYHVICPEQSEALRKARAIAADLDGLVKRGEGIVFFGAVGTGKDHLQAALLYEAARLGHSCRYVNGQELCGRLRGAIGGNGSEEKIIAELTTPQILAISDPTPPTGELNAWRTEFIYRLVNARYCGLKSTWATINAAEPSEIDEKLSAPVWDRLQEAATLIPCFWPSHREKRLAVRKEQAS